MLTREQVRELVENPLLVHMQDANEIVDTLDAALAVVEAARKILPLCDAVGDGGISYQSDRDIADALRKALAPFSDEGKR